MLASNGFSNFFVFAKSLRASIGNWRKNSETSVDKQNKFYIANLSLLQIYLHYIITLRFSHSMIAITLRLNYTKYFFNNSFNN